MSDLEMGTIIGIHILFGYIFFIFALYDATMSTGLLYRVRGLVFSLISGVLLINAYLLSVAFAPEIVGIIPIIQFQFFFPFILFMLIVVEALYEIRKPA